MMIILKLFAAAALLCALVFPEFIISHSLSFIRLNDYLIDYYSTFALTNFLYQGGVQLWDSFGQLSNAFFFTTWGVFKLPNITTAFTYYILAPFSDRPAELFQHVFSVVYILTLLFVRVIGIYLLLSKITSRRWMLWGCTVFFSVILSGPALTVGIDYQSFYPFMMYLILNFFTDWRARDLLRALLLFCILLSHGFLHTGYLYLHIHFFIISCLVWAWFNRRESFGKFFNQVKRMNYLHWRKALLLVSMAVLILAPYIYMYKNFSKDYALNLEDSRLSQMWSIDHYFNHLDIALAPVKGFFIRMMDFTQAPGDSLFCGYMVFFLCVTGVILWRDSRKWIFVAVITYVWMLNFPRNELSIGLLAHWINVLTNPLKTLVRAYSCAGYSILPYLFMPLMVMGMEAILAPMDSLAQQEQRKKWFLVVAVMGVFIIFGLSYLAPLARVYALAFLCITAIGVLLLVTKPSIQQNVKIGALIFLLAADGSFTLYQLKKYFYDLCHLQPQLIHSQPQLGAVAIDFQNPKILPFNEDFIYQFSYEEEPILWFPHNLTGEYYHVSNYALMFTQLESHNPKHLAFKDWSHDADMWEYISHNKQSIFFVKDVVPASDEAFNKICRYHLEKSVAMVDDLPGELTVLQDVTPDLKRDETDGISQWQYLTLPIEGANGDRGDIFKDQKFLLSFALPPDFPSYMATSIFAHEHPLLHFFVADANNKTREFQQAQGDLVKADTFDVNNIQEGYVTAAFSINDFVVGTKCMLMYPKERTEGVIKVWDHQSDHLDLTYRSPDQGWLVLQFPYDTHWQISIDGKPIHLYRVNKSFIGFPVTQGDHRVLVQYWPHSWLRLALTLSALLAFAGLIALFYYTIRD